MTGILGALIGSFRRSAQPAYEHIATTTLGASATVVEFAGLDTYSADYKHLQIRYSGKSTTTSNELNLRFNGVTTAVYARHSLEAVGSSPGANYDSVKSEILLDLAISRSTTANAFSGGIIDILDAFSTTKNTTVKGLSGLVDASTAIAIQSGLFVNTASIITITFFPSSQSIAVGSRFSIYGIRG